VHDTVVGENVSGDNLGFVEKDTIGINRDRDGGTFKESGSHDAIRQIVRNKSGNTNKGEKSAQVAVGNNTISDAVANPAGDQDTINHVGNTVGSANVTRNDLAIIDKELRTSDSQHLTVQGIKKLTIKHCVHVGSDLGTQDVVEEEVRQVGEESIVAQESVDNGRRELGERVVVGSEDSQADIVRVEDSGKSGAGSSGPES
jgi:hypothetical protein